MEGKIFQLSISPGGVPKLAVREAVVTLEGLEGDDHKFPEIHGGPERALCLFSLEQILQFQSEGHPIFPGAAGENVTLSGLDWSQMVPGAQVSLGDEVVVEITRYTTPCNSMVPSFFDGDYSRLSQKANPGCSRVYARVLREGKLKVGQKVRIINGHGDNSNRR
jgi:MOSC domain-containing protein YiiM